MKSKAFPGSWFFHLASAKCLSQEESTLVFARDLQNVLLTGKIQKALKREEIVQQALPSDNSKRAHVCAEIGRKAPYGIVCGQ